MTKFDANRLADSVKELASEFMTAVSKAADSVHNLRQVHDMVNERKQEATLSQEKSGPRQS